MRKGGDTTRMLQLLCMLRLLRMMGQSILGWNLSGRRSLPIQACHSVCGGHHSRRATRL